MKSLKEVAPWWLKIGAKIILARLPLSYGCWKRLGLFENGDMNQFQRALDNFLEHAHIANILQKQGGIPKLNTSGTGYSVLELGPGDSLCTAVIARLLGATKVWLVDAGFFATTAMPLYADLIDYLRNQGLQVSMVELPKSTGDILKFSRAEYLTDGVRSLIQLPSNSVDYCFSNAVLEHIPKDDFALLVQELYRVMKPNGVSVHRIDLMDHLGGGLNNLRFTNATWEGYLFRKSGFYTNRIRFGEMITLFEQVGFDCQIPRVVRWESLPTPRVKLDEAFRLLPEDDLLVSGFDVVLRRKN
jgi:SAM-dependent methyltransferase